MSREARDWVWDEAPIEDPRQLLILLSMADVADEYGEGAYPSVPRMARDSRSDPRTVQRHLATLIDQGVIEVQKKATQHRPTTYRMPGVDKRQGRQNDTPENRPGTTQGRHRDDTGTTNGDSTPIQLGTGSGTGSLSLISDETPVHDPLLADPLLGFPEFWEIYPKRNGKRIGRGISEQRWRKLNLDDRRAAWRGAHHYAAATDGGLTIAKDPERWLRGKCWIDWQEEATPDQQRPPRGGDPLTGRHELTLDEQIFRAAGGAT